MLELRYQLFCSLWYRQHSFSDNNRGYLCWLYCYLHKSRLSQDKEICLICRSYLIKRSYLTFDALDSTWGQIYTFHYLLSSSAYISSVNLEYKQVTQWKSWSLFNNIRLFVLVNILKILSSLRNFESHLKKRKEKKIQRHSSSAFLDHDFLLSFASV